MHSILDIGLLILFQIAIKITEIEQRPYFYLCSLNLIKNIPLHKITTDSTKKQDVSNTNMKPSPF